MFDKSADIYDAIYAQRDYDGESAAVRQVVERYAQRPVREVLDVGCGTGSHVAFMRNYYNVEGLDLDAGMLDVARIRSPTVTFHHGSMLDFDLGERFDAVVCLGGAIAATGTPDSLHAAVANMARHVRPGGVVAVEPWLRPDVYVAGTVHGDFIDEAERKIARIALGRREGDLALIEFNYLVGTPQGVRHFTELHALGLFTHEQIPAAFEEAGLDVAYEQTEVLRRGVHVGVKRGAPTAEC